jgi:hypothetical protein
MVLRIDLDLIYRLFKIVVDSEALPWQVEDFLKSH